MTQTTAPEARNANPTVMIYGPEGYGRCPRSILRDPSISPEAKWLWTTLEDYASPESPEPFPGQETLAEWAGRSVRTIQRWEKELVEAGRLLVRQRGFGRTSQYALIWPGFEHLVPEATSASPSDTTRLSSSDTTDLSGSDTTRLSPEAEPGEAEPVEATTPPTPSPRSGARRSRFDEWWEDRYPSKRGSKADARKVFGRLVRDKGWEYVKRCTVHYSDALDLFAEIAREEHGLDVRPNVKGAPAWLRSIEDYEEPQGRDDVMIRWTPVIRAAQAERRAAESQRPPAGMTAIELAILADRREAEAAA